MAFDQNGSTWQNLYILMNSNWVGALSINEEQTTAINALLIILCVPLFTNGIYPLIENRFGTFKLIDRMIAGMILAGISFIIMAGYQQQIDSMPSTLYKYTGEGDNRVLKCVGGKECMNGSWILIPYLVLTIAEVMFSISGLNLTYQEVGKTMKASSASLWLLMVAIGNLLTSGFAGIFKNTSPRDFFYINAGVIFAAAIVYMFIRQNYVYRADREVSRSREATSTPEQPPKSE